MRSEYARYCLCFMTRQINICSKLRAQQRSLQLSNWRHLSEKQQPPVGTIDLIHFTSLVNKLNELLEIIMKNHRFPSDKHSVDIETLFGNKKTSRVRTELTCNNILRKFFDALRNGFFSSKFLFSNYSTSFVLHRDRDQLKMSFIRIVKKKKIFKDTSMPWYAENFVITEKQQRRLIIFSSTSLTQFTVCRKYENYFLDNEQQRVFGWENFLPEKLWHTHAEERSEVFQQK